MLGGRGKGTPVVRSCPRRGFLCPQHCLPGSLPRSDLQGPSMGHPQSASGGQPDLGPSLAACRALADADPRGLQTQAGFGQLLPLAQPRNTLVLPLTALLKNRISEEMTSARMHREMSTISCHDYVGQGCDRQRHLILPPDHNAHALEEFQFGAQMPAG